MSTVRVVLADRGWILEKIGNELASRLSYVDTGDRVSSQAEANYFINYSAWREPGPTRDLAFFTHVEEAAPEAVQRFFQVAEQVERRICMSEIYAEQLRARGLENVSVIRPGVELERFEPKLRLGVAGRTYPTGRKGEALLCEIADLDFVEFHSVGGDWPVHSVAHADDVGFFRAIDYLLVPARYEGGPMPALEALAAGVPVISPEVGFVAELPHISYRNSDAADLRRVLEELFAGRRALRDSVRDSTWDHFAERHDRLFHEMGLVASVTHSLPSRSVDDALRILMVARDDTNGGGPSYRVPLTADELRKRGHHVEITTASEPDAAGFDLAHVFNIWEPREAEQQLAALRGQGLPVLFSPIYMDLLESFGAAATLLPLFGSGAEAHERAEVLRGFPNAIAEWVESAKKREPHPLEDFRQRVKRCLELSDAIAVLGEAEHSTLADFAGPLPAAHHIPNAPIVGYAPAPAAGSLPEGLSARGYVLCAARLERRKNQLLLIEALRGTGIPLLLVGAQTEADYAQLCRAAAEGEPVRFFDHLSPEGAEFAALLANAAVFALPSWIEGAPIAALDAASFGVRLALSDRGCTREYFGEHARYLEPSSVSQIRATVLDAFGEASRAGGPDEALREHVAKHFCWDRLVDATEAAYRSLCAGRVRPEPERQPELSSVPRKLEIGSGETPQPGYEHLDSRPDLPQLDHLHDALEPLPFADGTFEEVLSRSCVEHIPWRRAAEVLGDWVRVLRPGGTLRLYLPDLEYIARQYLAGRDDEHLAPEYREQAEELLGGYDHRAWALIKLFAGQEYPENFHYAAYDFESLSRLLQKLGLRDVRRLEPGYALHISALKS